MSMRFPSTDPWHPIQPAQMVLYDQDGNRIIFAGRPNYSVVTEITPREMDRGRYTVLGVAGRFHKANRQNDADLLARWESLDAENEREDNLLVLHVPFPRFSMQGYLRNLVGPQWRPRTAWFQFSFDFTAPAVPQLISRFEEPTTVFRDEGRRFATVEVDEDHSNLEDLMHDVRRRTFDDYRMVRQVISDELLTPSQARNLGLGPRRIPLK